MKSIAVIGAGYVGLVTGACLADFGMNVICVEKDEKKLEALRKGEACIFEDGLDSLLERNIYYKRLRFTGDMKLAVEQSEVIFIAVGTPSLEDGSADLQYVMGTVHDIASCMNGYKVIVDKSTVPVGTGRKVKELVERILLERKVEYQFDVVSNPEFLREGSAIYDFTHPDRIVLGLESERARGIMESVYGVLYLNETPFIITNLETAEMIKYAANAFLAVKITFINEIANLCEKVGADVHHVAAAMGRDRRIGPKFLHPGPGYGGSCFPKDTRALAWTGREFGNPLTLLEQTINANESQKIRMTEKIKNEMGEVKGKTICVLGITFKPNTDDIREAPALTIIKILALEG
ncbi:MAG TPA: UDP-glucose/GDP-mannose dehydrogenase family protein, partial [Negativicutes bacterium]|nr:UDP-glucose/GDP-mannose dehydrogenase family protein [Negativicutes bacterium]